jgi:hypothetical protein
MHASFYGRFRLSIKNPGISEALNETVPILSNIVDCSFGSR